MARRRPSSSSSASSGPVGALVVPSKRVHSVAGRVVMAPPWLVPAGGSSLLRAGDPASGQARVGPKKSALDQSPPKAAPGAGLFGRALEGAWGGPHWGDTGRQN